MAFARVGANIWGGHSLSAGCRALQVKHEASKNAMHRENERVLDSACVPFPSPQMLSGCLLTGSIKSNSGAHIFVATKCRL